MSATRRIVILGDSIAAGYGLPPAYAWPQQLARRLARAWPQIDWRLHNASIPGDATPDAYVRFDAIRSYQPHLLIISLGLNDCRRGHSPTISHRIALFRRRQQRWWGKVPGLYRIGLHLAPPKPEPMPNGLSSQTPPTDFAHILTWMMRQAQKMQALPALTTLPRLAPHLAQSPDFEACARYDAILRSTARATGAALIEIGHQMPANSWLADGVHLTASGQEQIALRVYNHFRRSPIASHLGLELHSSNAHMAPSLD